jgi:hypothetical protein
MQTARVAISFILSGALLSGPCAAQSTAVIRRATSALQRQAPVRADSTALRTTAPRAGQVKPTAPALRAAPAVVVPPQEMISRRTPAAAVQVPETVRRTAVTPATSVQKKVTAASVASQLPVAAVRAQETLAVARPVATRRVSSERLRILLGSSSATLRVVRANGSSDLKRDTGAVAVTPGDFVFRKLADTARRVVRAVEAIRPPRAPGTPDVPMVPPKRDSTPAATPSEPVAPAPAADAGRPAATFAMPYRWLTVDSAGAEHVLIPYFVVIGGGLRYDVGTRLYRGTALVGVEDSLAGSTEPMMLPKPLRMQLLATSSGGRVAPAQLAIAHTSLNYASVDIESPESTYVRIRTSADPSGVVIPIRVLDLAVTLTPRAVTLQGFGLATADVGLALPRGMARSDSAVVRFSSNGISVRPAAVTVTGATGGMVRLRSGLPGADTVRAFLDGVQVGEITVRSQVPIAFCAAMLLGTILGGVARFVSAKRRKQARALLWDFARGAPFGFIVAIGVWCVGRRADVWRTGGGGTSPRFGTVNAVDPVAGAAQSVSPSSGTAHSTRVDLGPTIK